MSPFYISLIIGVSGFLLFVILHVLLLQILKVANRMKYFNNLFLLLLLVVSIVGIILPDHLQIISQHNLSSFLVIFFILFIFYFIAMALYAILDHSVRTRLIIEMLVRKGQPLFKSEIFKIYNPNEATIKRLNQLVVGRYLSQQSNQYKLTSKGLLFAKISYYGKLLYKVDLGG